MENFDPKKAERVWKRVQGASHAPLPTQPEEETTGLLALISGELLDAAIYLQLSKKAQGNDAVLLRKLHEQELSHAACLKGIYRLLTGKNPTLQIPAPPQETTEVALRKCYGREMHSLAQYESRCSHPSFGMIFTTLAQQEREHCMAVLRLLGKV